MSNFMSNDDALQVLGTYAEDIKKGKGVIAVRETSPATAAHGVGEYVRYNGTTYKVKSAISIGDSLILNTNIEANGLPDMMKIYTPEGRSGSDDGMISIMCNGQEQNVSGCNGGGSGECDLFLIQLTGAGTVGSPYAVDVTPAELGDALDAGKYPVIMQYYNSEYVSYPFTWMEDDRMIFEFERLEDHQVNGDYNTVRSIKVWLEVNGTDWDTISIVTRDFDLTTKADKVSGATNGNFASLDANGNLADSGKKASDFLTQHQDISGKADKPSSATTGNFASFNASKNPVDSGKKASDFAASSHNHSAADINSSSTFGAQVKANATSVQTLGTAQVRNIYAGTSDMTAGTSALTTGDIYICYE